MNGSKEKYDFFIIVPNGLEKLAYQELLDKHGPVEANLVKGGIELSLELHQGLALNYLLKIPNRVLLRVQSFKCRDFPKLFNKLKKVPWNHYISKEPTQIHVSSKNSRIFDSRKIEKTFHDAFKAYRKGNPQKGKFLDRPRNCDIFFRFIDDQCTISINTSGERLHKRGIKVQNSVASLRENLAAAMFAHCKNFYEGEIKTLFNPMSGSGTLLLEAALFNQLNNQRDFDFIHFPLFNHQKSEISSPELKSYELIGLDQSQAAQKAFKSNFSHANLNAEFIDADFFKEPSSSFPSVDLTLINPPYGKRLKTEGEKVDLFNRCIRACEKWGHPQMMGIVGPQEFIKKINIPKNYQDLEWLKFENGGIPVIFRVFQRKKS